MAEERRESDERSRRALARAAAPAFHREGKPDMFRSVISHRRAHVPARTGQWCCHCDWGTPGTSKGQLELCFFQM